MRRILIDFVTVLCLLAAGIAVYEFSSSDMPLTLFARFENVIWIATVTGIAIIRVKLENYVLGSPAWWGLLEWVVIVSSAHFVLFWLDTVVYPRDNFKTVFAFGFLIFLVPSAIVSSIGYLVSLWAWRTSRGNANKQ
jgi:hypothetical protein